MDEDRKAGDGGGHLEERLIERESSGTSLIGYAAIKYFSWVIIVIAILYFLARYVLPMLS